MKAPAKKPSKSPIKNLATTGVPQTPSSSGTVHPGRTGPQKGPQHQGHLQHQVHQIQRPGGEDEEEQVMTAREVSFNEFVALLGPEDRRAVHEALSNGMGVATTAA